MFRFGSNALILELFLLFGGPIVATPLEKGIVSYPRITQIRIEQYRAIKPFPSLVQFAFRTKQFRHGRNDLRIFGALFNGQGRFGFFIHSRCPSNLFRQQYTRCRAFLQGLGHESIGQFGMTRSLFQSNGFEPEFRIAWILQPCDFQKTPSLGGTKGGQGFGICRSTIGITIGQQGGRTFFQTTRQDPQGRIVGASFQTRLIIFPRLVQVTLDLVGRLQGEDMFRTQLSSHHVQFGKGFEFLNPRINQGESGFLVLFFPFQEGRFHKGPGGGSPFPCPLQQDARPFDFSIFPFQFGRRQPHGFRIGIGRKSLRQDLSGLVHLSLQPTFLGP
mmetsp:Transcript_11476/g.23533  ORF Transcript_11476/g.23533 Transcript_11476/m.23533 type:complete len:331 (-) Transcript_11476:709-1701(-)